MVRRRIYLESVRYLFTETLVSDVPLSDWVTATSADYL
jgi:hypothetical protein